MFHSIHHRLFLPRRPRQQSSYSPILERLEDRLAPAGGLDPAFGVGGKVTTHFGPGSGGASDVAIDASQRIVAVGPLGQQIVVTRYHSDGSLDPSFDGDGIATIESSVGSQIITRDTAVALDPFDDGIVVVGSAGGFVEVFRLDSDGRPDAAFSDGSVLIPVSALANDITSVVLTDVAIDNAGRIVVAGTATKESGEEFLVVRLNRNGSLDRTAITSSAADDSLGAKAVALRPTGEIVIAGTGQFQKQVVVAQFTDNLQLDGNFGVAGLATYTPSNPYVAIGEGLGLALQMDGKVVVATSVWSSGGDTDLAVLRFTSRGDPDPDFDGDGVATTNLGMQFPPLGPFGSDDRADAVAIANGLILVAGATNRGSFGGQYDFAVVRYTPTGALDPNFGVGGVVTTQIIAGSLDIARAVALDANGNAVVAGVTVNDESGDLDFALGRYFMDLHVAQGQRSVWLYPSAYEQTINTINEVRASAVFGGEPFVGQMIFVATRDGVETQRFTVDLTPSDYGQALFLYTSNTQGAERIEVQVRKDNVTYTAGTVILWLDPPSSTVTAKLEFTNPEKPGDPRVPSLWGNPVGTMARNRDLTLTLTDDGVPLANQKVVLVPRRRIDGGVAQTGAPYEAVTNEMGQAFWSFIFVEEVTSEYIVTNDPNDPTSKPFRTTAVIHWVAGVPRLVTHVEQFGTSVQITGTLYRDIGFGRPEDNPREVDVHFPIAYQVQSGPNAGSPRSLEPDPNGDVEFDYTSFGPGVDVVRIFGSVVTDATGFLQFHRQEFSDTLNVIWNGLGAYFDPPELVVRSLGADVEQTVRLTLKVVNDGQLVFPIFFLDAPSGSLNVTGEMDERDAEGNFVAAVRFKGIGVAEMAAHGTFQGSNFRAVARLVVLPPLPPPPPPNTGQGTGVEVTFPPDPFIGTVSVKFAKVTDPGTTQVSFFPGGTRLASFNLPALGTFDVFTNAHYEGPIEICIDYTGVPLANQARQFLEVYHFTNGRYEKPKVLSHEGNVICIEVTSLSPFVIAQGALTPPAGPPSTPPLSLNRVFVARAYRDLTGRAIDAGTLNQLTGLLDQGLLSRVGVAGLFLRLPAAREQQVRLVFRILMHRSPTRREVQAGVRFLARGTLRQFEARLLAAAGGLQGAAQRQPIGQAMLSPTVEGLLVRRLARQLLGHEPSKGDLERWTSELHRPGREEAAITQIIASDAYLAGL